MRSQDQTFLEFVHLRDVKNIAHQVISAFKSITPSDIVHLFHKVLGKKNISPMDLDTFFRKVWNSNRIRKFRRFVDEQAKQVHSKKENAIYFKNFKNMEELEKIFLEFEVRGAETRSDKIVELLGKGFFLIIWNIIKTAATTVWSMLELFGKGGSLGEKGLFAILLAFVFLAIPTFMALGVPATPAFLLGGAQVMGTAWFWAWFRHYIMTPIAKYAG